jgi:hypothetical protein
MDFGFKMTRLPFPMEKVSLLLLVAPYRGHLGMTKTRELVGRQFWWPSLRKDSNDYVRNCEICQRNKPAQFKSTGLLQPLPVPDWRWESVSIDLVANNPPRK